MMSLLAGTTLIYYRDEVQSKEIFSVFVYKAGVLKLPGSAWLCTSQEQTHTSWHTRQTTLSLRYRNTWDQ